MLPTRRDAKLGQLKHEGISVRQLNVDNVLIIDDLNIQPHRIGNIPAHSMVMNDLKDTEYGSTKRIDHI